jgi:hypothetical protein
MFGSGSEFSKTGSERLPYDKSPRNKRYLGLSGELAGVPAARPAWRLPTGTMGSAAEDPDDGSGCSLAGRGTTARQVFI